MQFSLILLIFVVSWDILYTVDKIKSKQDKILRRLDDIEKKLKKLDEHEHDKTVITVIPENVDEGSER